MVNNTEQFRRELGRYREYLTLLAEMRLSPALRSKISASDVVQETLLLAHQHLEEFRGTTDGELAVWLRRILIRQLIDTLRKFRGQSRDIERERSLEVEAKASSQNLERWLSTEESSPSRVVLHREEIFEMVSALAKLPEDQRQIVEFKHLQGWSVEEISKFLNKSEASVAGLLRRGLKRLRELLNKLE